MPPSTSTTRRHIRAELLRSRGFLVMRPCKPCAQRSLPCTFSRELDKCVDCHKKGRKCDLAPNEEDVLKQHDVLDRLDDEILLLEKRRLEDAMKIRRKKTERRLALQRLKALNDQESKNILELEEDEGLAETLSSPNAALVDLAALSPSQFDCWLGENGASVLDTR